MGGHLCNSRITNRIITKFYRSGLTKDLRRHCASFDACQRMTPRGRFNKPKETCKVAMQEFGKVSDKTSHHFDKKAKHREFSPGDKVLILLLDECNKQLRQRKGPFGVLKRMGMHDYKV